MKTAKNKTNIIGLKEFRENSEVYIKRIGAGESFTVIKRSRPVFMLIPVDGEGIWKTVVDFTEEHPNGMPARDIIKALKQVNG